jgi:hypothetical protein
VWQATPRGRAAVLKMFRPDGNVLDGYTSSASLARLHDEAA